MNLLDTLTPECVKAPLDASDKKGVIDELVDLLTEADRVNDPERLKEVVWAREQSRTTGIGHGLAIPHGKSDAVPNLAMAIGKPAEPIDFASIDQRPVRLVVLLASPPDRTSEHIQALARISKIMSQEDFRERIYEATSAGEIYELLQSQEAPAS